MDDAVARQVRAYNAHDADGFVACYAADVVLEGADGEVILSGRGALRDHYLELFARAPELKADVVTRIRVGSWVIDEEHVTGSPRGALHAAAAYRVNADGLIDRVRFFS